MKNGQLSSFRQKIQETETFKGLIPVAKKVTLARNNVAHIHNGYMVAKEIGYTKWVKEYGYNFRNQLIIKNLLDNES